MGGGGIVNVNYIKNHNFVGHSDISHTGKIIIIIILTIAIVAVVKLFEPMSTTAPPSRS